MQNFKINFPSDFPSFLKNSFTTCLLFVFSSNAKKDKNCNTSLFCSQTVRRLSCYKGFGTSDLQTVTFHVQSGKPRISILPTRNVNCMFLSRPPFPSWKHQKYLSIFLAKIYRFLTFLISELRYSEAFSCCQDRKHIPCEQRFLVSPCFLWRDKRDIKKVYKQCKFCEEQKELTNEFKAKVIFISIFKMFSKFFNKNIEFFYRVTKKRHSRHPPPPTPTLKRTIDVSCG